MTQTPRRDRRMLWMLLLVAGALSATFVALWLTVTPTQIGRSDFTNAYVGGTLLRSGHAGDVYNEALQASLHSALIAPDVEGNLPFLDAPPAALLAAPVTLLPLDTAYRVWGVAQILLIAAAALIVARVAPWPEGIDRRTRRLIALAAASSVGTGVLLLQAQWDGVNALALAIGYAAWRRGHPAWAGVALALGAGLAKPHLALGLAVFLLFRRHRSEIGGALAATAALLAVSLAAVGLSGLHEFVSQLSNSTGRFHLGDYVSATGLTGVVLGDGTAAQGAGAFLGLAALAGLAWLSARTARRDDLLEPVLAVAVLASLFASPHVLFHDIALLTPAVVWCCAAARPASMPAFLARVNPQAAVLGGWLVVNLVLLSEAGNHSAGAVVPWLWPLLALACIMPVRERLRARRGVVATPQPA